MEGRKISILSQIKEDEQLFDSLITIGAAPKAPDEELDMTVPYQHAVPAQAEDPWILLGAKPKMPVSSTAYQSGPWLIVGRGQHSRKRSSRPHSTQALQLERLAVRLDHIFPTAALGLTDSWRLHY